jgi:hypothetical protein
MAECKGSVDTGKYSKCNGKGKVSIPLGTASLTMFWLAPNVMPKTDEFCVKHFHLSVTKDQETMARYHGDELLKNERLETMPFPVLFQNSVGFDSAVRQTG